MLQVPPEPIETVTPLAIEVGPKVPQLYEPERVTLEVTVLRFLMNSPSLTTSSRPVSEMPLIDPAPLNTRGMIVN
jgi:hypothetical protein